MTDAALRRLIEVMPPPADPISPPTSTDWDDLEGWLRVRLPPDFKEFLATYGFGMVSQLIDFGSPSREFARTLGSLRVVMESGVSVCRYLRENGVHVPFPIFPERGGLLPFGGSSIGDAYLWLTRPKSDPESWPIVVQCRGDDTWRQHPGPMTAFLLDVFEGRFEIPGRSYFEDGIVFQPLNTWEVAQLPDPR